MQIAYREGPCATLPRPLHVKRACEAKLHRNLRRPKSLKHGGGIPARPPGHQPGGPGANVCLDLTPPYLPNLVEPAACWAPELSGS